MSRKSVAFPASLTAAALLLSGSSPASPLQAGPVSLENNRLRLDFTLADNVFSFDRLLKIAGGTHEFVNDAPSSKLWEIGLRQLPVPQGPGQFPVIEKVYQTDCQGRTAYRITKNNNLLILTVTWEDCRPNPNDPTNGFDVILQITLDDNEILSHWNLALLNDLPDWGLHYASLFHGFAQESQDTYLVYPATGRRIRNPHSSLAANPTGSGYYNIPFTNWQTFQLFPYYTADGHGVYYATLDGKATYTKFTNLFGYGDRYELQTAYYVENSTLPSNGTVFVTPYAVVMGVFNGDWYDAAQIYRAWAQTKPILSKGKLLMRTDVPQWFKDLTVVNVGDLPDLPDPLEPPFSTNYVNKWVDIKNYQGLQDDDYFVFHSQWYDTGTVGYYAPRAGLQNLFQAFAAHDIHSGVHDTSFLYANSAPPSPCGVALDNAATIVNGTLDPFDPSGPRINPYTPFATCYVLDFVLNRLLPTGAVNKFNDNPYFYDISYDPTQGNPLGHGGSWLYDSLVSIMEQVRTEARAIEPKFVNTHEASFEGYIRANDATGSAYNFAPNLFVTPASASNETRIPLQATLYHDFSILSAANEIPDYLNLAGIYTDFEDINFVLAYGFNEGRQLTDTQPFIESGIANHELLDPGSPYAATSWAPKIVAYTLFLNKIIAVKKTAYGKKYLTYGQLMRPLTLAGVPPTTRTFNPAIWGSGTSFQVTAPSVLSSVWRASDGSGDVAILLTNFTNSPITFTLGFNPQTYGLSPTTTYNVTKLEPTGSTFLLQFMGNLSIPVTIAAKSVLVYEID